MMTVCRAKTPVGVLSALYDGDTITRVLFPDETLPADASVCDDSLPFSAQMDAYFRGQRRRFDLPMRIPGTPFRQAVYRAVLSLPYGSTATYGDIANAIDHPLAMRAVGTALRLCPMPVIIPCHRVVHKSNTKSAYRGGVSVKQFLLALENQYK